MSMENQIKTMAQSNKRTNNRTRLIITSPNDIKSYEIEDQNVISLYDLFLKAGNKIKELADIFIETNYGPINNVEVHNEAMLKFSEFLSSKGYVIGIIQYDSHENKEDKYCVRLYVHQSYSELNNSSNQYYTIEHICRRLNLADLDINEKIKTMIATVNIGSCVIFDRKQQLLKSAIEQSRFISKVFDSDNFGMIVRPDDYCIGEDISIYNPKLIKKPIEYEVAGIQSHRNRCLIFTFLHNSFSFDTNQKVLFVPKDILGNDQQVMILKSILNEYEDMRKSNNNLPISLTIYVDGVFLKKLSKDSFKWNYKDLGENDGNGEDDYLADTILNEIKERLDKVNAKESR